MKFLNITIVIIITCLLASIAVAQQKTQAEFAVQLCKVIGIDVSNDNCIPQLEKKDIIPHGGWQPDRPISNREMGDLLISALGLEKGLNQKVAAKLNKAYRDKATILRIQGKVFIRLNNDSEWVPAQEGMKLSQDASIKTEKDSWAELRVGMVGGVRIKQNTELNLVELSSTSVGSENIILYMNVGEMLVDVRGIDPDSDFQVRTPTTIAGVRGTIYNIAVKEDITEINAAD